MLGPLEQAGCDASMIRHMGALRLGMKAWVRAPMLGPSSQRSLGQLQQSKWALRSPDTLPRARPGEPPLCKIQTEPQMVARHWVGIGVTHLLSSLWIPLDSSLVWTCGSLHGAQGGERDGVRDKIIGFPQTSLQEHESIHGQICIWPRQSEHVLEPQTSNICLYTPDPRHMHLDPRPSTFTPVPPEPQCNAPQTPTHASTPLDFQHIHLYPRYQHMQPHHTFRPPNTFSYTLRPSTRAPTPSDPQHAICTSNPSDF